MDGTEPARQAFPPRPGDVARHARTLDWSDTDLGPPERWPASLREAFLLALATPQPMAVLWGERLSLLYNDAWAELLGSLHPVSLARPVADAWPEAWEALEPAVRAVLRSGEGARLDDRPLPVVRGGLPQESYATLALAPLHDEEGRVRGVCAPAHDTTDDVLAERRLRCLQRLGTSGGSAKTREDAARLALDTLARYRADVPFALLYTVGSDGGIAKLAATLGLEAGARAAPPTVQLDEAMGGPEGWPLGQAFSKGFTVLHDLPRRFGDLPGGPWPEPATSAVIDKVPPPTGEPPEALLVAGVSPRLRLDDDYRGFFDLVARQIAAALALARIYGNEDRLRRLNQSLEERVQVRTEALAASEARFRQMFLSSPIPIVLSTPDDVVLDVNPAFERFTGFGRAEAAGSNRFALGLWTSASEHAALERSRADGAGPNGVEVSLRTRNGERAEILASVADITLDGKPARLAMFVDITERKRTEQQLNQALQEVMKDTSWLARSVFEKLTELRGEPAQRPGLRVADLTPRERDVLYLVADAKSNQEIGRQLGLAPSTVRNYIATLYSKLGVGSRAEAVVWARERGLGGG